MHPLDLELTYNMLGSGEHLLGGSNVKLLFVFITKEYRGVDERRRAYSAQLAWSYPKQF